MRITKTAEQAQKEKAQKDEEYRKNHTCPTCSELVPPSVYRVEHRGVFRVKLVRVSTVKCFKCGTEWEYEQMI